MSGFKNIQLPPIVLANVYKDNVIVLAHEAVQSNNKDVHITSPEKTLTPTPNINDTVIIPKTVVDKKYFLGDNGKGVVIVVKDTANVYLDEDKLQLLSKILVACKMNLADVAIFNFMNHPLGYKEIREVTAMKYLLLFDVTTTDVKLPFSIPNYQPTNYDSCTVLCSADLSTMLADSDVAKAEKMLLWGALKKMW